jgi:hypothetical protein
MEDTSTEPVDINHPDTQIEATNKSLSEFVAEHVKGFVEDPKEKGPLGDKDENPPEALSDDKKDEDEDEGEGEDKSKDDVEGEEGEEREEGEKDSSDSKGAEKDDKGDEEPSEELVEGKPVPYTRFQEVIAERTELKQKYEQAQPIVENYTRITDFCREHTITPDQFEKAMRVQALLNTNPSEALKELVPIVEALQGFVGNKLPDDIQKAVDEGKIDPSLARDYAQARAQAKYRESMAKQNAEVAQRTAQERAVAETTKAAADWERAKRTSDPDYVPVEKGKPDGLWEDVRDKFAALLNQRDTNGNFVNPVHSPQQMVELQERAYKMVKEKWTNRLSPKKPPTKKTLSSNGGTSHREERTIETAKSMKDAIAIRLKQRGIEAV